MRIRCSDPITTLTRFSIFKDPTNPTSCQDQSLSCAAFQQFDRWFELLNKASIRNRWVVCGNLHSLKHDAVLWNPEPSFERFEVLKSNMKLTCFKGWTPWSRDRVGWGRDSAWPGCRDSKVYCWSTAPVCKSNLTTVVQHSSVSRPVSRCLLRMIRISEGCSFQHWRGEVLRVPIQESPMIILSALGNVSTCMASVYSAPPSYWWLMYDHYEHIAQRRFHFMLFVFLTQLLQLLWVAGVFSSNVTNVHKLPESLARPQIFRQLNEGSHEWS